MEVKVYKRDGSASGSVTLDASVFGITPNDHVIWLDVRSLQANARQGTHKAKERGEVRGGGAKPWRQKGTGRARAGTSRSPIWVGGGTIFGPRPHQYSVGVNRKTKQLARRSALSYKAQDEAIRVIENFEMDMPRTRDFVNLLEALSVAGQKVLLLTSNHSDSLYKSGRNIRKVVVREAKNASTFDLVNADVLLIMEDALDVLSNILGGEEATAMANESEETAVMEAVEEATDIVDEVADMVTEEDNSENEEEV